MTYGESKASFILTSYFLMAS